MVGVATEESGVVESSEQILSGKQLLQPGEALDWRSSEQVENGSPSTSPSNWDSDDGDPKPSDLYGHHTWKIENFSQIHKRELRSESFEIGGYKWYILVYPQGCDVCNHISLFLCVANHDKHLPGWSHFAQFTICVVNKDPKKSKYSDTLHRFWKKEHDWGWKKFMELSKVFDGFIVADTLIIKAQVQVIRERADRPFRCLDNEYRGELIRVYLTNVEQICRRFVEERRSKLGKLIEDKARWSSFRAFWLGMDKSSRHHMAQEKTESILKVVVKYFFIEKEVTSTLVMDSLYCGLKALKGAQKGKSTGKHLEAEEIPVPIVRIEKDAFILVDDVLLLFERAALEPLPPKDDKGPQNRTKDGSAGEEFNKDSIERDERRLTELGRRTIEISVLSFIFSKIEVAHQEAVALRKQEELIRECLAEDEQKARRGAADKEKKSKKKQGKQKRKGKDKAKDEKTSSVVQDKVEKDRPTVETKDLVVEPEMASEKSDAVEEVSNVSDSLDCDPEFLSIDSVGRDASLDNWDTDTSEVHLPTEGSSSRTSQPSAVQNGTEGRSSSVVDDGSSSCSTVSAPVTATPNKANSHYQGNPNTPSRGRNHQIRLTSDKPVSANEEPTEPSGGRKTANITSRNKTVSISKIGSSSRDKLYKRVMNKEEETRTAGAKDHAYEEALGDRAECKTSLTRNPPKSNAVPSDNSKQIGRLLPLGNSTENTNPLKPDPAKFVASPKISKKPVGHQIHVESEKLQSHEVPVKVDKNPILPVADMSKPLNTSLVRGPWPPPTVSPLVPRAPVTVTSSGHLGPELVASAAMASDVPQSYRNAAMGVHVTGNVSVYHQQSPPCSSVVNSAHSSYSQASAPQFSLHNSDVMGSGPSVLYETMNHRDMLQNRSVWIENTQRDGLRDLYADHSSHVNHVQNFNMCNPVQRISQNHHQLTSELPACNPLPDEFPHLDIINDLLNENEHGMWMMPELNPGYQSTNDGPHNLSQHYSPANPLAPSPSSCRFDWARGYHDDLLKHGYGASGRPYDALGDMIPHSSPQQYSGEFLPEPWQVPVYDPKYSRARDMRNGGGYPYQVPEYANRVGMDGNPVFRSSSGHL